MVETAIEDDWVNCGDKMFLWFDFNARNWEFLLEGMQTLFLVGLLHSRMSTFFQSWGADGMSDFSPVQAVGPNDLRFKVHTVHTTCPLGFQTWSVSIRTLSELYPRLIIHCELPGNCTNWLDLWLGPWMFRRWVGALQTFQPSVWAWMWRSRWEAGWCGSSHGQS